MTRYPIYLAALILVLFCRGEVDPEAYRPLYHLDMPGDPSGCIKAGGVYHLFTWDHVTSTDLIHWTSMGWPFSNGPDNMGYWTGSVVLDQNASSGWGTPTSPAMIAVYTAHDNDTDLEDIRLSISTNHQDFLYYSGNPVVDTTDPLLRDPQVFWHEPTSRWIMVVARSLERKLRFYSSPDLRVWTQLSEFGPLGGRKDIWEVPGLIQVPIAGQDHSKWVLFSGLGPNMMQYYVGDFDGTTFTLHHSTRSFFEEANGMNGTVFENFESGSWANSGWTVTGNAFGDAPRGGDEGQPVTGYVGDSLANSYVDGDWRIDSKLLSPEFTIEKRFINFLIGGGNHPGQTCINLLVDDLVVLSTTGEDSDILKWRGWDVSSWIGQSARIQIVDDYSGFWGRIYVDHILFSDTLYDTGREHGKYLDWGSDFYGGRFFQNYDENEEIPVMMGWLGNWTYAPDVPTPWNSGGSQSLPREVLLEARPGGYQMIQRPHPNLQELRGEPVSVGPRRYSGGSTYLQEFHPAENSYEIEAVFNLHSDNQEFGLHLCAGSAGGEFEKLTLGYNSQTRMIYLDRRHSGDVSFHPDFANITQAPFATAEDHITFHLFVDKSSIEVFVNGGKRVLSTVFFPNPENRAIEIFSEKDPTTLRKLTAWPMSSTR